MISEIMEQHRKVQNYRATLKLQQRHAESENICQQTKDEIAEEQQKLDEKLLRGMQQLTKVLQETNRGFMNILAVIKEVEDVLGLQGELQIAKEQAEEAVGALDTIFGP
jgi:phage/plasmid primase-like uncharacterized protein